MAFTSPQASSRAVAVKFLFFSPHTLLDSSSGAALCVSALLGELHAQGHECMAITGSITDSPNALFAKVPDDQQISTVTVSHGGGARPVYRIMFHGVPHLVMKCESNRGPDLRATEELAIRRLFMEGFAQFNPDVMITYGGFLSNIVAGQHALARGRTSVLYAASDTYLRAAPEAFSHGNIIHTVSHAMRDGLNRVSELPKVTTKTFVRRADVVANQRAPEFITFFNPIPPKGAKLFAALVSECHRLDRPYKFLCIEGRGTRSLLMKMSPELRSLNNIVFAENTADVRKIYERTSVCLYPSFYPEPAGRVPIEANMNGIPVLACNSGGIAEMLDGAGFLFEPPADSLANYEAPVIADAVAPWIDVLDRLHNNKMFADEARTRAKAADAMYDIAAMARTFVDAMATTVPRA